MKKLISILISLFLVLSSISIVFACDPKDNKGNQGKDDKNKKKYSVISVNDNTTSTTISQFQYIGNWNYGKQHGAYKEDNHWSKTKDSYYSVSFSGTQIKLYGAKANMHGIAAISIDGGNEKNVDCYSQKRRDNTLIYESPSLKDGQHTLIVRVTGNKNRRSKDYNINVDKVEITSCSTPLITDTQAPSIPTGLTAIAASTSQINLNWNVSSDNVGVTGYKVYRNGSQIGTVTNGTCYSDKGLTPGTTSYSISSFDAAGNNSAPCLAVAAATQLPVESNLALNKVASSDSVQQGYNASLGNDGNMSTLWCAADGNPNHWWKVDLGANYNLTGTEVTWQFGQKLYKYKIEVSTDNTNWNLQVDKTNTTSTDITQKDNFFAAAVRYVRITITEAPSECWAAFYEFKVSGSQASTTDTLAPSIPTGLIANPASTSKINLSWNASTDNVGVTGYKVFRNGVQVGTVTNGLTYSDSGLAANTQYSYVISAFDAAGNNSAPTSAVNATTQALSTINVSQFKTSSSDSEQPGYSASSGNDGNVSTLWCASDGNVNHWWKVDLGANYNLSGSEVTWQFGQKLYKYKIEVSPDDSNWTPKIDKTNNTDTKITQKDSFIAEGVRYVRITVTGVPSECWAAFYEFKVFGAQVGTSDVQAPTVPIGLSATSVSTTQINLNWTASTDNVGVQGYKVYRNNKQVGTVLSGTAYSDTGLESNKTYSYAVSAFDAAGNNSSKCTAISIATQVPVITNLALNKAASSDSQQPTNTASKGNDGSLSTRWSASDTNINHWWTVDLGANYNLSGTEITWELPDKNYKYKIEVSNDNVNWSIKVDKTGNSNKQQIQKDDFSATSVRYVRITITGLSSNCSASFYELKVFGYPV